MLPAILVALALSIMIGWESVRDVWLTGIFHNTDDAVRIVQVRDWLAGQAWYDLQMKRLGMPGAPDMHWSRIVDIPLAFLLELFGLILDPERAERAARLSFTLVMLLVALWLCALIATELLGASILLPAMILIGFLGFTALQFRPGAVDHHAPQIVLLLLAVLKRLQALRSPHRAFLCAMVMSVSISISLENLPSLIALGASFPLLWMFAEKAHGAALRNFGAGLLLSTPVIYAATVPPARWFDAACDAQSVAHLTLFLAAGLICWLLASLAQLMPSARQRIAICAVFAFPTLGLWLTFFSHCLSDPYIGIDPVVREHWLNRVREAQSIASIWHEGFIDILGASFIPAGIGAAGIMLAIRQTSDENRQKWIILFPVALTTIAVASMRVAYVQAMHAVTCFGCIYLVSLVQARARELRLPAAFALSNVFISMVMFSSAASKDASDPVSAVCSRPDSTLDIERLEKGLVLAPMNEGAFLLAFTRQQILAAPYHRNNEGNRIAIDVLRLSANEAFELIGRSGIDYLAVCNEGERSAPVFSALLAGETRPGTERIETGGPYAIWRIRK